MPSDDETFFCLRRLHAVFAVSAAALLAATIWMIVADHRRPWKVYQRTFREQVEPWLTAAELRRQQTDEFAARDRTLWAALEEAGRAVPSAGLVERFCAEAGQGSAASVQAAYEKLARQPSAETRQAFWAALRPALDAAQVQESNLQRQLRFRRAEFDQARSYFEAGVGEGAAAERLGRLQGVVDEKQAQIAALSTPLQAATAHRQALDEIVHALARPEDDARRALAEHRAAAQRLERLLVSQQPNAGKRFLESPLVDAFGRPLGIEQVWLPDLTIDYHFGPVARFDRCGTCHQGIDKTAPGRAHSPAIPGPQRLTMTLATPKAAPAAGQGGTNVFDEAIRNSYGLELAGQGILARDDATIALVLPKSRAADALLAVGDVIAAVGAHPVVDRDTAQRYLMQEVAWGQPLRLAIRRGLPHPYASHPRLDLFVGASSPHPVAEFGCTICHEGQGSATDFAWASHTPNEPVEQAEWRRQLGWFSNPNWDHPMLPARFAQSRCLKCHHQVTDLEPSRRFPDAPAAKLLAGYQLVRQYGCFGCHEINGFDDAGRSVGPDLRLEPARATGAGLTRHPGTMRKVGPSLSDVAGRLDWPFLADWIANPAHFRPASRMPRLFGMYEQLRGQKLTDARRFEAVEIRAIAAYLASAGRAVEPLSAPAGVTEPPSAERGKHLFQLRGCLACHRHHEFPAGQSTEAADLSNLGAKYPNKAAADWVTSWIRDPLRHAPRTKMPNLLLQPIPLAGNQQPMSDPAADIAAWLLADRPPGNNPWAAEPPSVVPADLDELVGLYQRQSPVDAEFLTGPASVEQKLRYVGRRTIRKRGCYGCHDIPGFEAAQPIGPALSDWGRKPTSLLAFEQINRFVHDISAEPAGDPPRPLDPATLEEPSDRAFFSVALLEHRREGFLWQKLRAPRSFDYEKAQNKGYHEQLLMGKFALSDAQREAISTFILGLVAEPPAARYVYRPDPRREAIVAGRKVLDKYACAQCHTLEMERWTLTYDPARFPAPPARKDYDFLKPQLPAAALAASKQTDLRGLGAVEVAGMPRLDAQGKLQEDEDDDGNPVYAFSLWEPAAIDGHVWTVGGAELLVGKPQLTARRPPLGGTLARLLCPAALAEAKAAGSTAAQREAWGWLPPPLAYEGSRVQPAWLYDYLLAPRVVRPAALLRMPQYNLSPDEAAALADYFAAAAGAEFPYVSSPAQAAPFSAAENPARAARMEDALQILRDRKTYCLKCHLVGDDRPSGDNWTILAPNLENVASRVRPDYLRRWLANPQSVLPYTPMPVNFPPTGEPLGQDLLRGTSLEQLDAVLDLLLHYQGYMSRRSPLHRAVAPP